MAEVEKPIIIKKITIEEGGHHGGAWKVAYADFVTAMMAFFLLLWILSTSSQATKEGLADFFTPTVGIKDSEGIGFKGGISPSEEGTRKSDKSPPGIVAGAPPTGVNVDSEEKKAIIDGEEESNLFEKGAADVKRAFEDDPNMRDLRDNIVVEQSPEGLKIDVTDSDKYQMFEPGGAVLTQHGRTVLKKMLLTIERMPNYISITGHTDATPFSGGGNKSNWELSTDRALAARQYLLSQGMTTDRVGKIVGRAAQELLVPEDPKSPRNRRLTIILLRGAFMTIPLGQQPATRSLLSVPKVNDLLSTDEKQDKKPEPIPGVREEPKKEVKPVAPKY